MNVDYLLFNELKDYWKSVKHFDDNKKYVEIIKHLGPFTSVYDDPKRKCYGLFDNDKLIGATMLVQWSPDVVRYRTINIVKEHRGKDLGWDLLRKAWDMDWQDQRLLMGWIKEDHIGWSVSKGFKEISEHYDNHVLMIRDMND